MSTCIYYFLLCVSLVLMFFVHDFPCTYVCWSLSPLAPGVCIRTLFINE